MHSSICKVKVFVVSEIWTLEFFFFLLLKIWDVTMKLAHQFLVRVDRSRNRTGNRAKTEHGHNDIFGWLVGARFWGWFKPSRSVAMSIVRAHQLIDQFFAQNSITFATRLQF
jgi:hypothetical protein